MTATPDPITVHVAAAIVARRHQLGLSQRELGEAVGKRAQQISKYEDGSNRVSVPTLCALSVALRCEPADLLPYEADDAFASLRALPEGLELADLWSGMDATRRASLMSVARALRMPSAREIAEQLAVA